MAVIGGFRSDLSITLKTDGNLETLPGVFWFLKSRINVDSCIKSDQAVQKSEEKTSPFVHD